MACFKNEILCLAMQGSVKAGQQSCDECVHEQNKINFTVPKNTSLDFALSEDVFMNLNKHVAISNSFYLPMPRILAKEGAKF
ncbi:hypothetical protein HRH25_19455 [Flavisolibacter sp. BT320]|nr:hypothetical protein [Flavisolibacter longurius]